jgi:hypothetical protein
LVVARNAERCGVIRQGQMRHWPEGFDREGCSGPTETLALRPGAF